MCQDVSYRVQPGALWLSDNSWSPFGGEPWLKLLQFNFIWKKKFHIEYPTSDLRPKLQTDHVWSLFLSLCESRCYLALYMK